MSTIIPSVLHPTTRAYQLSQSYSDNWDKRGSAPLFLSLTEYQTFGDGTVQHSGDWCAQFSEFTDVCLSLARAIFDDPQNEAWNRISDQSWNNSRAAIAFALSLVWRDGKTQYYNLQDRKVSSAPAKQYDKRWARLEPRHDGSCSSAFSILIGGGNPDWFERVVLMDQIRDVAYQQFDRSESWDSCFKPLTEVEGDWGQAFTALSRALEMVRARYYGERVYSCALHNSKPAEPATVAA